MRSITDFLHERIMGRTLYTDELIYSLENGALEGVYADQMTFSNLLHSPTGLRFDLFVVSRERLYETDGNGGRAGLRKDFSAASLFHYELARRRSTGAITGFMRFVSSSLSAVPAEAMASSVLDFRLEDDAVLWSEKEIIYRDQPGPGDTHRPVAFEARCRLFTEGDKARYEYDGVCLDVNPADHSRTPSASAIPKFLSREP